MFVTIKDSSSEIPRVEYEMGPPQVKPPPVVEPKYSSTTEQNAGPADVMSKTTTPPSQFPTSSTASTRLTQSSQQSNETPSQKTEKEMETQEMRTSYVEEPPSAEATLSRNGAANSRAKAAALVRRVTNEMALAHYVQKVEINSDDINGNNSSAVYSFSHLPEQGMRRIFWYLGKALSNHSAIFAVVPLILIALCFIAPAIHYDRLQITLPFHTLVPHTDRDVTSSGVGLRRIVVPVFNSTNPSYAALDKMNHHTYVVLIKNRNATDTILRDETIAAYSNVRKTVQSISFDGKTWPEMCGESCSMSATILDKIVKKSTQIALTYPETYVSLSRDDNNLTRIFLASTIGGVELDVDGAVASAQSLLLPFQLNKNMPVGDTVFWESSFMKKVEAMKTIGLPVKIYRWSYAEFANTVIDLLRKCHIWVGVSIFILIISLIIVTTRVDAYKSKPVVGFASAIVVLLSALAALAVSVSGSAYFNPLLLPVLFVIIGLGTLFCQTMQSAWTKFSAVALHPSEKIGLVMAYEGTFVCAASCILIVMFVVSGLLTQTPFMQSSFLTMAAGVTALLILTLLFLTVFIYKAGRREARGCKWYHFCRSGDTHFPSPNLTDFDNGALEALHDRLVDTKTSFTRQFAAWLLGPSLRYPLIFLWTIYLLLAVWGCINIKIELNEENFLPSHSEPRKFLDNFRQYYGRTEEYLEITLEQTLDYSNDEFRKIIIDLIDQPVKDQYATRSVNWLADFGRFAKSSVYEINQDTFVPVVRLVFLTTDPYQRYSSDIVFDRFQTQITRSRMYLELSPKGVEKKKDVITSLLAKARELQLPITIKAPFVFSIQHDLQAFSSALLAFGVMMVALLVISLLIFGQPTLSFVVVGTSLCVIIETAGYASLWGVPLNTVTMTMAICANSLSCILALAFCYEYANSGKGLRFVQRVQYTFQSSFVPIMLSIALPVITFTPLLIIDAPLIMHIWRILLLNAIASLVHLLFFLPNVVSFVNENACSALSSLVHGADDESSIYYIPTAGRIIPTEGIYQSFYSMPKIAPPPSYLAIGPAESIYGHYGYGRFRRPSFAEPSVSGTPLSHRFEERRRNRGQGADHLPESIYEAPPSPKLNRSAKEEPTSTPQTPVERVFRREAPTPNSENKSTRNPVPTPHWRQFLSDPPPSSPLSSYASYNNHGFVPR